MIDLLYVAATALFFALMFAYVRACDSLVAPVAEAGEQGR